MAINGDLMRRVAQAEREVTARRRGARVDWRSRAIAAEQALASVRSEASKAADDAASEWRRGPEVLRSAVLALDRIVLLCDGEALRREADS